jgi:transposase
MTRQGRYPQELRERAVRMVFEHQDEHPSQWAAICSIAAKFGISHETLRNWVRRAEVDDGLRPGLTSEERERLKTLEREVRELRRANEILKSAAAFFGAELDRRPGRRSPTSTLTGTGSGSSRSAGCCRSPRPPITTPAAGRARPVAAATRS